LRRFCTEYEKKPKKATTIPISDAAKDINESKKVLSRIAITISSGRMTPIIISTTPMTIILTG
jgi:hypothetical protein